MTIGPEMSDEKIIEFKDFEKVNGEVKRIKPIKKSKASKKSKKNDQTVNVPDYSGEEISFEDMMNNIINENEMLYFELLQEKTRCRTLEKILNKTLKINQDHKNNPK